MTTTRRGSRLTGLLALIALLLLVFGIPAALLTVAGNPLQTDLPAWQDLLSPDDGSLFLSVLVLVGWLAWASFTFSVLLETFAALRGARVPRLPALHLQQHTAATLVAAAAVLFTLGGPAMAIAAPPAAVTVATAPASSAQPTQQTPASLSAQQPDAEPAATASPHAPALREHLVTSGESLWSIAEDKLGDGARYAEIAQLNYGAPQPDGRTLTDAHWLHPGWTLKVPAAAVVAPDAAAATPREQHTRTVKPGDTLTDIAQDELGDASRFEEIAAASRDVAQPEGAYLTDPDFLRPGWTVVIPGDPAAGAPAPTPAPAPAPAPAAVPDPAPATASPAAPAAPPVEPAAPAQDLPAIARPGQSTATPSQQPAQPGQEPALVAPSQGADSSTPPTGSSPPAAGAPQPRYQTEQNDTLDQEDSDQAVDVRTVGGVGALLCAGVISLLAVRRRRQQEDRQPGADLPLPSGASAGVEQDLRATADPLTVETVDLALRTLAHRCTQAQRPLPCVRAARLTDGQFDLYLAEPAALPAPWAGTADATVWTLPADADGLLEPDEAAAVPAPYPSLVTIGHDEENGHVLLDLEHLGALTVSGDQTATREILTALAVELATSRWADDLQVTLVGAGPELEDILRSGRIRYQPAVGHVLDDLTRRADADRASLAEQGASSLQHARSAGTSPDAWTPEIVLLAGDITNRQRQQLQDLVEQLPRVAIAAVTTAAPMGEWALRLDGPDTAVLEPIGLQIRPQRLDDATCAGLLDVLSIADEPALSPQPVAPEPTLADLPSSPQDLQDQHLLVDLTKTPATVTTTTTGPPAAASATPTTPTPATGSGSVLIHVLDDSPTAAAAASTPTRPHSPCTAGQQDPRTTGDEPADHESAPATGDIDPTEQPPAPPTAASPPAALADARPVAATPDERSGRDGAEADLGREDAAAKEPDTRPAPRLLLLGRPELIQTHGPLPQDSQAKRYTELAALLALHPGLTTIRVRDLYFAGRDAQGRAPKSTTQAISRLRRWLGEDAFLPRNPKEGRYALGPAVSSDWQDFRDLLPDGPRGAASETLEQALALVRDRPMPEVDSGSGLISKQYSWAEHEIQKMRSAIVDAAHELARRRLMEGRHQSALDAADRGLLAEPGVERLWRLRIMAARAGGDQTLERDAVAELLDLNERQGRDLEPATSEMLQQLHNPGAGRVEQLAHQ